MRIAIILAGGTGSRMNLDVPKQYLRVKDKPIFAYSISTIENSRLFDKMWIVCEKEYEQTFSEYVDSTPTFFSNPGDSRQLSIMNALEDMNRCGTEDDSIVMIHDAARPFLSEKLIKEGFDRIKGHDGVLPIIPMKDTVYECDNKGKINSLLNRERIFAGQAPEFFYFGKYLAACRKLSAEKLLRIHGSTEPAVMDGLDIVTIEGDENNFKITTQSDLEKFREML